ncbi:MAG: hypothetical protein ACRC2B_01280 [Rubrivivax sp.]
MLDTEVHNQALLPAAEPRRTLSLWTPGLRLMRRIDLRQKALVLLLCSWLPVLLLLWIALLRPGPVPAPSVPATLRPALAIPWASDAGMMLRVDMAREALRNPFELIAGEQQVIWVAVTLGLLVALYLTVCAWIAIGEGLSAVRRSALALSGGALEWQPPGFGTDELGQALAALHGLAKQVTQLQAKVRDGSAALTRASDALASSQPAQQREQSEIGAANSELGRRTIAVCGALDAGTKEVDRIGMDLDALQDEEGHTQQLMAAMRARLLALNGRCHALGEAAQSVAASTPGSEPVARALRELVAAADAEIVQCHQLSERFGAAGRSGDNRIESMRRCGDAMVRHAERGMLDARQLMVLTRQVESSLAAGRVRVERLAADVDEIGALAQGMDHTLPPALAADSTPDEP